MQYSFCPILPPILLLLHSEKIRAQETHDQLLSLQRVDDASRSFELQIELALCVPAWFGEHSAMSVNPNYVEGQALTGVRFSIRNRWAQPSCKPPTQCSPRSFEPMFSGLKYLNSAFNNLAVRFAVRRCRALHGSSMT